MKTLVSTTFLTIGVVLATAVWPVSSILARSCEFELQTQTPGNTTAVPFPHACSAQVQCAIHPKMKMTVEVAPARPADRPAR